jgi:hypothetical protein
MKSRKKALLYPRREKLMGELSGEDGGVKGIITHRSGK